MPDIPGCKALCFTLLTLINFPAATLDADDWPQILGPHRNGVSSESIPAWDKSGPTQRWSRDVGSGFAGVAAAGNLVICFDRMDQTERLTAYAADSGETVWDAKFPASYRGGINPDRGPRCVPVIAQDRVFAYGAAGDLHCVSLKDGTPKWSRSLAKEYRALEGYFGIGSTPIVAGDLVLVNVGGRADAGLVAVRVEDGKTAWNHGEDDGSYSSPTMIQWNNKPHVVFVTRLYCVGVAPQSGEEVFRFRFGKTGPTVNAATPLTFGDYLFLSASYQIGAQLHQVQEGKLTKVWANDESMSSQYTTCVYRAGMLYGIHGREDAGLGSLRCINAKSGEIMWQQPSQVGHVLLAKDRLLVQEVTGQLTLVAAESDRYKKLAEYALPDGEYRAIPALSNGRLIVRNSQSQKIHCLEVNAN